MKVLSLFDGISCGRIALQRAGIPVEIYYASEIDKYAMEIVGFISRTARTNSKNNFERGSLKLSCFPAKENPWHGLPPIIKSTFPAYSEKSIFVQSPS